MDDSHRTDEAHADASASTVRHLFGRDMIYLGSWATQLVLTAAMTPVATRLLPPSQFGRTAAAVAVMQLVNALLSFGLDTAVQRAYGRDRSEEDARRLVTFSLLLAIGGGLVLYGTGRWWCPAVGLGPFPVTIRYAVIWGVLTATTGPGLSLVRSRDQLRWFLAASAAQSIFAQILALSLVALIRRNAATYLLGQTIGQLITVLILLSVARPLALRAANRALLTGALRFSVGLVPTLIASFLMDASDRLVIHGDLGSPPLARYTVARNVGGFAITILSFLDFVWLPRLFAIADGRLRRDVLATSRDTLYLLTACVAVAIAAASPLLLRAWAPSSYRPGHLLLITALVATAAVPTAAATVCGQALILAGRTKTVGLIATVLSLANVGLNLLLVPRLGIDGSAGITVALTIVGVVIVHLMLGEDAPPIRARGLLIAIAGCVICICSAAVSEYGLGLWLRMLVAVAAVIVFVVTLANLAKPNLHARLSSQFARLRFAEKRG